MTQEEGLSKMKTRSLESLDQGVLDEDEDEDEDEDKEEQVRPSGSPRQRRMVRLSKMETVYYEDSP